MPNPACAKLPENKKNARPKSKNRSVDIGIEASRRADASSFMLAQIPLLYQSWASPLMPIMVFLPV